MKKQIVFILLLLFVTCAVKAQVLYIENFDNHSIGNLGADVTGKIPGQWGWYTDSYYTQADSFFTIVNETGRGKVLDISTGLTDRETLRVWKTNLHPLIANRTAGNDVLMFEYDYYTGAKQTSGGGLCEIKLYSVGDFNSTKNQPEPLGGITFMKATGIVYGSSNN